MGRILQEFGLEEERLILEKEAVDTTTNAHNVLKLVLSEVLVHQVNFFRSNTEGSGRECWLAYLLTALHLLNSNLQEKVRLIIVTSAYHLPRSTWLFRSLFASHRF